MFLLKQYYSKDSWADSHLIIMNILPEKKFDWFLSVAVFFSYLYGKRVTVIWIECALQYIQRNRANGSVAILMSTRQRWYSMQALKWDKKNVTYTIYIIHCHRLNILRNIVAMQYAFLCVKTWMHCTKNQNQFFEDEKKAHILVPHSTPVTNALYNIRNWRK